jgi:hypothetical protein
MSSPRRPSILAQISASWHWKCALLSAVARSIVYLVAMARTHSHGRLSVVVVEMAYVTLTAGIYAGMQQRALGLRSRLAGNLTAAVAVPALAQTLDVLAHLAVGAAVPARATIAVCVFAAVSAAFHLHIMRRGVFITGERGHSLVEDFRRIPRLLADFVLMPYTLVSAMGARLTRPAETEAAL